MKDNVIKVRLPKELAEALKAKAKANFSTISAEVRAALLAHTISTPGRHSHDS